MSMRQQKFRIVVGADTAIDHEAMTIAQMREYLDSRDEQKIAPFIKAGSKPTWFHIREIAHDQWDEIDEARSEGQRYMLCFQAGVIRVENLVQEDGPVLTNWEPSREHSSDSHAPMSEKNLTRFSRYEVQEVGRAVYQHSFLASRMRRSYLPPLSCLEVLGALVFRRADVSPSSPATSSDAASPAEESQAPGETAIPNGSPASGSGAPMVATATGTPFQVA